MRTVLCTVVTTAAVVVLPLLSAARCGGEHVAKDCSIAFRGLRVDHGLVGDVVTPTCDVPPQSHTIKVELEFAVGGKWLAQGRSAFRSTRPDATGFAVTIHAPCLEGTWRTSAYAEGVGSGRDGFSHQEYGTQQTFSVVDCAR